MNIFTFTGNLGKDCEIKATQSGKTMCIFSVAVKSGYGDNVKTTWPRCIIFGKRAEGGLREYLIKGAQVCVSGELSLDEWQDNNGVTQKMLSVNVREIDLIGGKQSGLPDSQQSAAVPSSVAQPSAQGTQNESEAFQQPDDFDSDIPF